MIGVRNVCDVCADQSGVRLLGKAGGTVGQWTKRRPFINHYIGCALVSGFQLRMTLPKQTIQFHRN
jgi:hypothetical protein